MDPFSQVPSVGSEEDLGEYALLKWAQPCQGLQSLRLMVKRQSLLQAMLREM